MLAPIPQKERDVYVGVLSAKHLVKEIRKRNVEAFECMVDLYSSLLYGCVFRKLNDQQLAETVCCRVFTRVWRDIDQFDDMRMRPFTWIMQLAAEEIDVRE